MLWKKEKSSQSKINMDFLKQSNFLKRNKTSCNDICKQMFVKQIKYSFSKFAFVNLYQ